MGRFHQSADFWRFIWAMLTRPAWLSHGFRAGPRMASKPIDSKLAVGRLSICVAMFMAFVLALLLFVYLKFFGERERLQ